MMELGKVFQEIWIDYENQKIRRFFFEKYINFSAPKSNCKKGLNGGIFKINLFMRLEYFNIRGSKGLKVPV